MSSNKIILQLPKDNRTSSDRARVASMLEEIKQIQDTIEGVANLEFSGISGDPMDNTELAEDLNNKSDKGHNHDDRYYTETEIDNSLAGKSDDGHNHDDRYYFKSEVDTALGNKADDDHTHDGRYYTESEIDALIANYYTQGQIDGFLGELTNAVTLEGTWDASLGSFPGGGTAQTGHAYQVSADGTVNGVEFKEGDRILAVTNNASTTVYAGNWLKLDYSDQVESVAGLIGTITKAALLAALNVEDGATADQSATEVPFTPNGDIEANTVQAAVQEVRDDTDTKLGSKEDSLNTDQKRTITHGTAAPSGGSDGDIYLQHD